MVPQNTNPSMYFFANVAMPFCLSRLLILPISTTIANNGSIRTKRSFIGKQQIEYKILVIVAKFPPLFLRKILFYGQSSRPIIFVQIVVYTDEIFQIYYIYTSCKSLPNCVTCKRGKAKIHFTIKYIFKNNKNNNKIILKK